VFEDRLNHASLLDAGLLSRARCNAFPMATWRLERAILPTARPKRKLIVSDGVFSMDGDLAPLHELADDGTARTMPGCWWTMPTASACSANTGAWQLGGVRRRRRAVPLLVGTLGKGFGSFGAFVAAERDDLIETLIQQARPYIYTTALPPAVAEATRASLRLVREEHWRREN
jgi:8-amino-7-oxononanoate synthase